MRKHRGASPDCRNAMANVEVGQVGIRVTASGATLTQSLSRQRERGIEDAALSCANLSGGRVPHLSRWRKRSARAARRVRVAPEGTAIFRGIESTLFAKAAEGSLAFLPAMLHRKNHL